MLISLNEIKNYVDIDIETPELLKLIGSRLVEIEGTIDLSEKYKNIKIVKVESAEKIEGTHLTFCKVNDGTKDLTDVVCGAPNVRAGTFAVWLQPGCTVPVTFGKENFVLDVRKLRGYESHGMLAALDELDLGEDHAGIVEIDPEIAEPGADFAKTFGLNDIILDIENKSLTHRPDCFGILGFAREIAGILGKEFKEPDCPTLSLEKSPEIKVEISDQSICPRYSYAVLKVDSVTQKSPYLTKNHIFLAKAGMHSISDIVDATNIVMLKTGQPLHAFDFDKFKTLGGNIVVRLARPGEKLVLLDDKEIELNETDIVICADDTPVALAGAMGGKSTAIDENTKTILLESATFSLYHLRKTQMSHGLFTEAITRFTKGQPASGTLPALSLCASLLPATLVSASDFYPTPAEKAEISISVEKINSILGTTYPADLIEKTLKNVGFKVENDKSLKITPPAWRTDIHIEEDIIEEVGRLLGYDNIPLNLPLRPAAPAEISPVLTLKSEIRHLLTSDLKAHEILTYSFISKNLLKKSNQPDLVEDCYEIVNSISPELQLFRPSLLPSLLDKVSLNLHAGYADFSLFEMNQISRKSWGLSSDTTPALQNSLALTLFGNFFSVKSELSFLFARLHKNLKIAENDTKNPLFIPGRSALIKSANGETLGLFGEISPNVLKNFKISGQLSAFELNLDLLLNEPTKKPQPVTLSKFPSVSRDLTFKISSKTPYASVEETLKKSLKSHNLLFTLAPASIYKNSEDTKNLSFHLTFSYLHGGTDNRFTV